MLRALSEAIEARDPHTRGHARRVTALAEMLARRDGWPEHRVAMLRTGAQLHDIGKVAVELTVLTKPSTLTRAERAQMRLHPAVGAKMLAELEEAQDVRACVLNHHERWDGRGYPLGRAGEQIPLEARVLAIADAFDAMTSYRPYRPTLTSEQALAELQRCAGSQFDPRLVDLFVEAWRERGTDRSLPAAVRAAAS